MISLKKKASGLKIPFLAISIIPLDEIAPIATPKLARIIMFLKEITLDPIAEFKKLTYLNLVKYESIDQFEAAGGLGFKYYESGGIRSFGGREASVGPVSLIA